MLHSGCTAVSYSKPDTSLQFGWRIPDQPRRITFGFPDFWASVVDSHPEFFRRAPNLESSLNSVLNRGYDKLDTLKKLLFNMLMLVAYGFNEAITLVGNGMGHGALKIVRGIVENSINAEYIRLNPEQAHIYLHWGRIETYKAMDYFLTHKPNLAYKISKEFKSRVTSEFQASKHLFETKKGKSNGSKKVPLRDSWCQLNLRQRAEQTGFADIYLSVMPEANAILHGSVAGLVSHIDARAMDGRLEPMPNLKQGRKVLIVGHAATLITLERVASVLDAQPNPDIKSLNEDFETIWKIKSRQEVYEFV